jgi:hypothetical protein
MGLGNLFVQCKYKRAMLIKRIFIVFSLLFFYKQVFSQFSDNQSLKEDFIFEVIQIEEFIQRFNFDANNRLFDYLKSTDPELKLNRKSLLYALSNYSDTSISNKAILKFIEFVCDTSQPQYLNFYDNGWYAEVNCVLQNGPLSSPASIFLKSQVSDTNTSKWVIAGVRSDIFKLSNNNDTSSFFSPVSHGTDFVSLYNFFEDTRNLPNYLSEDFTMDTLTYFVSLVANRKLKLIEMANVRYHFTQIPNWIFVVDYFNRREPNAGWLISKMIPANEIEKKNYIRNVLSLH